MWAVQREGEGEARSGEEGEMPDRAGGSAAVLGLMKRRQSEAHPEC